MSILDRIKRKLSKESLQLFQRFKGTYYISLGENCLTDNLLERYKIKSFSSPYSHGRSNIDYIINLEKNQYEDLLNVNFLYHDTVGSQRVVRNSKYSESDNIFHVNHLKGFEFTHHNVIESKKNISSYERKIARMLALPKTKKVVFFYHYRFNENYNQKLLVAKMRKLLTFYHNRGLVAEIIWFSQELVQEYKDRDVIKVFESDGINGYIFKTMSIWEGSDNDIFFGRNDDDLFTSFFANHLKYI